MKKKKKLRADCSARQQNSSNFNWIFISHIDAYDGYRRSGSDCNLVLFIFIYAKRHFSTPYPPYTFDLATNANAK